MRSRPDLANTFGLERPFEIALQPTCDDRASRAILQEFPRYSRYGVRHTRFHGNHHDHLHDPQGVQLAGAGALNSLPVSTLSMI